MKETINTKTYLGINRACSELRRGGVILVRLANGEAGLFRAAELIGDDDAFLLSKLAGSVAMLVVTNERVSMLGRDISERHSCVSISINKKTASEILNTALGAPAQNIIDAHVSVMGERPGSLADVSSKLLRLAKLIPAVLLARIASRDLGVQKKLCDDHNILLVEARDIASYENDVVQNLRIVTRARVPLKVDSTAEVVMFRSDMGAEEHFAVLIGDYELSKAPLVRIHSQCVTGDVLGSLKCDCGQQLMSALTLMAKNGGGVLIYLAQEGRNIGLINKMRAYALQDEGLDTIDSNHALGFGSDERGFLPACKMLEDLNVRQIRLITNNPDKIAQLHMGGVEVVERVPLIADSNEYNEKYIETKQKRCGHFLG